jgi:hypothetical protein
VEEVGKGRMVMHVSKRTSHRSALVFLFRDGQWKSMREVQQAGGWRYAARICELRRDGFDIQTRRVGADVFEYRWNRSPKQMRLPL